MSGRGTTMRRGAAVAAALVLGLALGAWAQAPKQHEAKSLDELLDMVRKGTLEDRSEYQKREAEFRQARDQQAALLKQAEGRREALEAKSGELEKTFQENEERLVKKQQSLNERLGALKELFGVLQQVSGDAQSMFNSSLTSVQYPERSDFLREFAVKMGRASQVASIEEIERLWFELQREMTESGKVVEFPATVTLADGDTTDTRVVRVGLFNAVASGQYLNYSPETKRLTVLARQPASRYQSLAGSFQDADEGLADFGVDPSRGAILALLIQLPSLWERIGQGGLVGYATITFGLIGFLLALERIWALTRVGRQVEGQARSHTARGDNPLGRVLKVYEDNPTDEPEALERRLDEAIMKEVPPLNRFLAFIRLVAVVAPLMGLLGTVTGMIKTFQAIVLFGTGDPKVMAGGISEALVTTVIGLCVAVPMLLMHTAVSSRSKRIVHVLEEQSTGLVAARAEEQTGKKRAAAVGEARG